MIGLWACPLALGQEGELAQGKIRSAVERALPLIQKSAGVFPEERACFSCHHQALPVLAMTTARERGFSIDEKIYARQLDHTAAWLKKGIQRYREGKGQGGRATTAGYALWTLELGDRKPDAVTEVVAGYLLETGKKRAHWFPQTRRPPSEASNFTTTAFAVRGLQLFAAKSDKAKVAGRIRSVLRWLEEAPAEETEDRVFRLQALAYSDADGESVKAAVRELLKTQRDDGGWSQKEDMKSDAYATGSALVALHQAGGVSVDDPAYPRGLRFLIRTQRKDGSWHVKTRSRAIQKYFESGFPHGKDQFISMAASCWAATALALALD